MFSGADLLKHVRKVPFVPFRLMTSSGQAFDIFHPELIMVGTRDVTIGLPSAKNPNIYDDQIWVAMMHITSIMEIPAVGHPSGGNGQGT